MLTTIYFDQKPVFLATEKNKQLETYTGRADVLWIDQATPAQIPSVINRIQSNTLNAAVLLTDDTALLLDAFKKDLKLIQAAGGLVHTNNDELLLIFRRGKWDLPKGKLDEGEDLETCAIREIAEETGLWHLEAEAPLCITYHTYHHKGKHVLKESHWYLVLGDSNDVFVPQTDEDIEQCLWVRTSELAPYLENTHGSIMDVVEKGLKALNERKKV
jgi:8-oxo-dGTP pyrophosphatase MutT (NUDIX family)